MSASTAARPRVGAAIFLAHVLLHQVVIMAARVTTSYRVIELDLAVEWLGVIAASFAVLPVLVALSTGALLDRHGERPVMLAGAASGLLGAAGLLLLPSSILLLVVCNLLLGLSHLFCVIAQHAYTAGNGPAARRDLRFGHYTAVVSLGQVVAPLLIAVVGGADAVPDTTGLFALAVAAALFSAMAVLAMAPLPRPQFLEPGERNGVRTVLRYPGVPAAIAVGVAVMCSIDLLMIYLPVLGAEALIPAATVAVLLTVRAAVSLLSRLAFGILLRTMGRRALMTAAMAALAFGFGVLAFPLPVWAMHGAMMVTGFGIGVATPLTLSWITGIVPEQARGLALSLRLSGNRAGQFVLPLVAGLVIGGWGIGSVFGLLAVVLIGLTGVSHAAIRDDKRNENC